MSFWLMKSEPEAFSIDDLASRPDRIEPWDGVRNYQARNLLRDRMQAGDRAFFYHSNCSEPGIVGLMHIMRSGYPDDTAFDPSGDPANPAPLPSSESMPVQLRGGVGRGWYRVDVRFERKLRRVIRLAELKIHPQLANLALVRKGNRLSVLPVSEAEWNFILSLE